MLEKPHEKRQLETDTVNLVGVPCADSVLNEPDIGGVPSPNCSQTKCVRRPDAGITNPLLACPVKRALKRSLIRR